MSASRRVGGGVGTVLGLPWRAGGPGWGPGRRDPGAWALVPSAFGPCSSEPASPLAGPVSLATRNDAADLFTVSPSPRGLATGPDTPSNTTAPFINAPATTVLTGLRADEGSACGLWGIKHTIDDPTVMGPAVDEHSDGV